MIHATPLRYFGSILRRGILAERSKGAIKTVWLTTPGRMAWAIEHVKARHKCDHVAVFEVDVPRSWLRRGGRVRMKHTGGRDIPRKRLKAVTQVITGKIEL